MMFKVIDEKYPSRGYFHNGKYIQFQNYQATVDPSVAYRMSRVSNFKEKEFDIPEQPAVPFNQDSWEKEKRMIWLSNVASASGFGSVTENVLLALLKQGITILNPGSISGDLTHGGEFVNKNIQKALNTIIFPDCLEIQYVQPPSLKLEIVKRIWGYHMFETTHTPKSWIKKMNKLERVLVPSSWLIDSWREQGLTVPISVFYHGVDPKVYFYKERPIREPYTFLHFGQLGRRKGTDLVVKAFLEEFTPKDDVRLILKGNTPFLDGMPSKELLSQILSESLLPDDEFGETRIKWTHAPYSKKRMQELMFKCDCFVWPSRGEGFGLTALEAMATGLPVITTGWSGMVDYSNPSDTLILEYKMVESYQFDIIYKDHFDKDETAGLWAESDFEQLKHYMRWCYENKEKAKEMGRKAAKRVKKYWTWDHVVKQYLLPVLDASL